MKKQVQAEKLIGKVGDKFYELKKNSLFTIIVILFIVAFFIRRYFNALTNFQYLELVNIVSIIGLFIVIGFWHLADHVFELNLRRRDFFFVYLMSITGITLSFLYFKFQNYDKIEHFFFPMMFASIVFYVLSNKLKISLFWRLFFTFFIIVGSLSIFELVEYFLDIVFDWKMQGVFIEDGSGNYIEILNKINDTMIDIALGVVGTLIYVLSVGHLERKNKQKH